MKAHRTSTSSNARATPLRKLALAGFQAVCEAFYPDNDFGAPSWRTTEMMTRVVTLWDALPPQSRLTLEALYAGLELGGAALMPWVGRLSGMSIDKRYKLFERMRKSRAWPLRFVAEAVKSSSTMVYISHPAAARYIGVPDVCLTTTLEVPKPSRFSDLLNAPLPTQPADIVEATGSPAGLRLEAT